MKEATEEHEAAAIEEEVRGRQGTLQPQRHIMRTRSLQLSREMMGG